MRREDAVKIIIKCAAEYEAKVNNRHFLIIYKEESKLKYCEVGFRDINFLHLTGVKTNLSAKDFYDACKKGRLSARDISIGINGTAQQKLMVLPYLGNLLYNNCFLGYFANNGIYLRADYFVGDSKAVLSIGFRNGKKVDIPVTLYKENVKALIKPVYRVLAVLSKRYDETDYETCTFLAKGAELQQLKSEIGI